MLQAETYKLGAVTEFLRSRFGGLLRERETTVDLLGPASFVVDVSYERVILVIANLGANAAYVAPSPQVSATRGLQIFALTGVLGFFVDSDAILPALPWYAICPAGATSLYVLEVYRDLAT